MECKDGKIQACLTEKVHHGSRSVFCVCSDYEQPGERREAADFLEQI